MWTVEGYPLDSLVAKKIVQDVYPGRRSNRYRQALTDLNSLGMFRGSLMLLGKIQELEDMLDIYRRQLRKERQKCQTLQQQTKK